MAQVVAEKSPLYAIAYEAAKFTMLASLQKLRLQKF